MPDYCRLSSEAQRQIKLSEKFEDVSLGDNRPTALIQQYGMLYSQTRVDTMDSLDSMPELDDLENLKNKLLLSVIVVGQTGQSLTSSHHNRALVVPFIGCI